jgi:two-component system sensor histidine kinase/response regulator
MDKNLHRVKKKSPVSQGKDPTTQEYTETRISADSWKHEFLTRMGSRIRKSMDAIVEKTDLVLRTDLDKEQRGYLETVQTSVESLLSQFNDILDFSKIYAHGLELETIDFDLHNTLENAAEVLAVKAQDAGLALKYQIEPDVPGLVRGDPGRLRQIIVSITQTVIRSTQKGKVIIRLEKKEEKEPFVLLHFAIWGTKGEGSTDKITGSPEGPGPIVDFNPQEYGDSDLGLALSKQFIGMMGGQMWVKNGSARDLCFTSRPAST